LSFDYKTLLFHFIQCKSYCNQIKQDAIITAALNVCDNFS
jgi:hypothetical protein